MFKKSLLSIVCILSASVVIAAPKCPTGRQNAKETRATKPNIKAALQTGSTWKHPTASHSITFSAPMTFKLDYNGQNKNVPRIIVLGKRIGFSTKFKGLMKVGPSKISMTKIYFEMYKGKCSLRTKTNPNEYSAAANSAPTNSVEHHTIKSGANVARNYQWVRVAN